MNIALFPPGMTFLGARPSVRANVIFALTVQPDRAQVSGHDDLECANRPPWSWIASLANGSRRSR